MGSFIYGNKKPYSGELPPPNIGFLGLADIFF